MRKKYRITEREYSNGVIKYTLFTREFFFFIPYWDYRKDFKTYKEARNFIQDNCEYPITRRYEEYDSFGHKIHDSSWPI